MYLLTTTAMVLLVLLPSSSVFLTAAYNHAFPHPVNSKITSHVLTVSINIPAPVTLSNWLLIRNMSVKHEEVLCLQIPVK